jgi:hypothetical protein
MTDENEGGECKCGWHRDSHEALDVRHRSPCSVCSQELIRDQVGNDADRTRPPKTVNVAELL